MNLNFPILLFFLSCITISSSDETPQNMSKTFLYFAYGSNMLTKRIHINNPTAIQRYIGKIKDHRLDFIRYSNRWKGCASTIVPDADSEVWGVVWEIDNSNIPNLDHQEGVHENIYFPKNVNVNTTAGKIIECRVYQQTNVPTDYVPPNLLPTDRQPSLVYLKTMINGAKENHIPEEYIKFLESFKHNGFDDEIDIRAALSG